MGVRLAIAKPPRLRDDPCHETVGPADIEMNVVRRLWNIPGAVEALRPRAVVEMVVNAVAEPCLVESGQERGLVVRLGAIVRVKSPRTFQMVRHRNERREADTAAGQDGMPRIRSQREQIAGWTDLDARTRMEARVNGCRATARGRIEQHAKPVDASICRVSAQRILPDHIRQHFEIDVGAGRPAIR